MMLRLSDLVDVAKCYDRIRKIRWPHGTHCPHCDSNKITKRGKNHRHQECRRYSCEKCGKRFDDLTGTIFMGHHQPLPVWLTFLYLMGLNVSNHQIAEELGLDPSDGQAMAKLLRGGIVQRRRPVRMKGVVECDEVYVVAPGTRVGPTRSWDAPRAAGGLRVRPGEAPLRRRSRRSLE